MKKKLDLVKRMLDRKRTAENSRWATLGCGATPAETEHWRDRADAIAAVNCAGGCVIP
jgi:hypothetical protein